MDQPSVMESPRGMILTGVPPVCACNSANVQVPPPRRPTQSNNPIVKTRGLQFFGVMSGVPNRECCAVAAEGKSGDLAGLCSTRRRGRGIVAAEHFLHLPAL